MITKNFANLTINYEESPQLTKEKKEMYKKCADEPCDVVYCSWGYNIFYEFLICVVCTILCVLPTIYFLKYLFIFINNKFYGFPNALTSQEIVFFAIVTLFLIALIIVIIVGWKNDIGLPISVFFDGLLAPNKRQRTACIFAEIMVEELSAADVKSAYRIEEFPHVGILIFFKNSNTPKFYWDKNYMNVSVDKDGHITIDFWSKDKKKNFLPYCKN